MKFGRICTANRKIAQVKPELNILCKCFLFQAATAELSDMQKKYFSQPKLLQFFPQGSCHL